MEITAALKNNIDKMAEATVALVAEFEATAGRKATEQEIRNAIRAGIGSIIAGKTGGM